MAHGCQADFLTLWPENCFIHRHELNRIEPVMPNADPTPRLQLSRISKRYPGCLANDAIDLTIAPRGNPRPARRKRCG